MVADGNHHIGPQVAQRRNTLAVKVFNRHAVATQYLQRLCIDHALGLNPGAVDAPLAGAALTRYGLCHNAAAGIAGTKKDQIFHEYVLSVIYHWTWMRRRALCYVYPPKVDVGVKRPQALAVLRFRPYDTNHAQHTDRPL